MASLVSTAQVAAREGSTKAAATMGRKVRRMFNAALHPPPQADPDPGNPVPFVIRKDLNKYRAIFYIALAGFVALTVSTPRTYLFDPTSGNFRPEQLSSGIIFLVFVVVSHFLVTGSDPGYLDIDVALHIGEEHAQHQQINSERMQPKRTMLRSAAAAASIPAVISSPQLENSSTKKRPLGKVHAIPLRRLDQDEDIEKKEDPRDSDDDVLESSKLLGRDSDAETDDDDVDEEPDEMLDQSLSGIPIQQLPTRAKYCRKSKRVVATYDHHCRVLNTTIGERNRARFWFLLLWSTVGICWLLSVVHSGFRNAPASVAAWFERNGHALAAAIVCWIMFLICAGLFIFHTFLMLANVTTYEFMRSDKVGYLSDTKDFDLPFSMGLSENIKFYFSSDSFFLTIMNLASGRRIEWKPHLWTKPISSSLDRNSGDVCRNLWENRYWSCC